MTSLHEIPNQIICVAGKKGSGKDAFCDILVEKYGFTKLAYADALKQMCLPLIHAIFPDLSHITLEMMYDRVEKERVYPDHVFAGKPFSIRWFLQFIGTDVVRVHLSEDVWVDHVLSKMRTIIENPDSPHIRICVSDCRFTNEVDRCRSLTSSVRGLKAKSVRIYRQLSSETLSSQHVSEENNFETDYNVDNSGSFENLERQALEIIRS